jgi:predicted flavoprotein YhiN
MSSGAEPATALVVGGGPGGLMAAEVLATAGLRVTVVEHMPSVGRKLLLAGRSGLNLTHSEPIEAMLGRYGQQRRRLEQAIDAFGPADLRAW